MRKKFILEIGFMLAKVVEPNKTYHIENRFEGLIVFDGKVKFYTRRYIGKNKETVRLFGEEVG